MPYKTWELGFHLRSPKNWMNDPNGLCQFRGSYWFYYQYDHDYPTVKQKAWGLFVSEDLVHWRYEGAPIEPSIPEDRHGVYSGSAIVERGAAADGGDRMRVFYTGNVICPGVDHDPKDVDLLYHGREGNEITCTSDDGIHFGEKTVVLRNCDYPGDCGLHVRDPKVWEQDGELHMVLGARSLSSRGMCLVYDSTDGVEWRFRRHINSDCMLGFMWECPNVVLMDGYEFLAFSPQGLPRQHDRWHNLWQAGYVPLPGRILDTDVLDERDFTEWDHGHDFYAPQTFCDDSGRWILVGWLGGFEKGYEATPDGLSWWHCLTVPRLLTRDDHTGLLLQNPVPELEVLRGDAHTLSSDQSVELRGRHADVVLYGIDGEGTLTFDDGLQVFFESGRLGVRYLVEAQGAGRKERSIPCDGLHDLRVLVDGSVVEVYANGGRDVFSLRWFCPADPDLAVATTLSARVARAYAMEDVLSPMYATAKAPDLALPGYGG